MARTYKVGSDLVLVNPNWSITDKINARSTLNIKVVDKKSATIAVGKSFTILEDAKTFFQGIIVKSMAKEVYPNYIEYSLSVADNSAIADRRVIAKSYESQVAGDIVKDIITEVLGDEGVTQGTIEDGPTITKAVFNYIECSQALDFLKTTTGGYVWNIDKDKKLNFYARTSNIAPYTLNDSVVHKRFTQNSTMDQYRNTQYARGGKGRTAVQTNETPSPKPDGESRNFVVRFPIAEKPVIETNLNGAGWVAINPANIGINGLDTGKEWYYRYNSEIITQDTTETVLGTADAIRVTYTGLRNLFVKTEDAAEITDRKTVEGGTGIYENLAVEKSIDETTQALEFSNGLLATYGEIKDIVKFETEVTGLEAGQLLTISKTAYGISDTFLIESINIVPADQDGFIYKVTCLDGASVGGWEEFFKNILRGGRDFAIEANEVIILLVSFSEISGAAGQVEIDVFNALYPADDLYPSDTLYPNNEVASEVTLND
jgi:hypothetical protein